MEADAVFSFPPTWARGYAARVERNIGLLGIADQDRLLKTRIAVLGTGGLGAPLALQLAHLGCGDLVLCDQDIVEASNLNRQPFCVGDIGKKKVDVLAARIRQTNPDVRISTFLKVTVGNVSTMLDGVAVAALALDGALGSVLVAREARERGIPMVESWAVPYLFAWWFTGESEDYESVYELQTRSRSREELSSRPELLDGFDDQVFELLFRMFPGFRDAYSREPGSLDAVLSHRIPDRSLAPFAWLNASLMAFEVVFAGVLRARPFATAPCAIAFDYFRRSLIPIDGNEHSGIARPRPSLG